MRYCLSNAKLMLSIAKTTTIRTKSNLQLLGEKNGKKKK